jgi:hypothetical chaperone protein
MFCGFDYGTSNCAIGIVDKQRNNTKLLPLEGEYYFLPSCVYALGRELICEQVALNISNKTSQQRYLQDRAAVLQQAAKFRRDESIGSDEQSIYYGRAAFSEYFSLPDEGYFVKSAKSFLGVSGVRAEFINFFEDIVTLMMMQIKQSAEQSSEVELTSTVIGRPVNFQGINAEKSNTQALNILTNSAKKAGFKDVEFLYEPIAAGLDFEKQLSGNKKVLVVDIGGGTSDCAMVCMGPDHINKVDRYEDFIGHSGERIGGNDFDIHLAAHSLMPHLGMKSTLKAGLPMPTQIFWDAVSTNDVGAQATFYSLQTSLQLKQLLIDTSEPELLKRLINIRNKKQNQQIVRRSEESKIALSEQLTVDASLSFIEKELSAGIHLDDMRDAARRPLQKIVNLMREAVNQANVQPDIIYITGGSAKSPIVREAVQHHFGDIEVVDGDHFGSVANGLTLWSQKLFS